MKRLLPAVLIATLFHVTLFAIDPGLLMKQPGKIQKPAITVTMSYRRKPSPPPPVEKPLEIKKEKKMKVANKVKEPAAVKAEKTVPETEPVKNKAIVEEKPEPVEEEVVDEPVTLEGDETEGYVPDKEGSVVVTEAIPLYRANPEPAYPRLAKKRGYQGTVLLSVLVNKEGTVDDLWLFESSGYKILDNAAIDAVKGWTFEPGRRGSEPVEMWVEVPVRFEIR
jgi:protein TonB